MYSEKLLKTASNRQIIVLF